MVGGHLEQSRGFAVSEIRRFSRLQRRLKHGRRQQRSTGTSCSFVIIVHGNSMDLSCSMGCSLINCSAYYCCSSRSPTKNPPIHRKGGLPLHLFFFCNINTLFYFVYRLVLFDRVIFPFQASSHEAIGLLDSRFSCFRCYCPP